MDDRRVLFGGFCGACVACGSQTLGDIATFSSFSFFDWGGLGWGGEGWRMFGKRGGGWMGRGWDVDGIDSVSVAVFVTTH